jgi:hypothetical protein
MSPEHSPALADAVDESDHEDRPARPERKRCGADERIHAKALTPGAGVKVPHAYAAAFRLMRRDSADFAWKEKRRDRGQRALVAPAVGEQGVRLCERAG